MLRTLASGGPVNEQLGAGIGERKHGKCARIRPTREGGEVHPHTWLWLPTVVATGVEKHSASVVPVDKSKRSARSAELSNGPKSPLALRITELGTDTDQSICIRPTGRVPLETSLYNRPKLVRKGCELWISVQRPWFGRQTSGHDFQYRLKAAPKRQLLCHHAVQHRARRPISAGRSASRGCWTISGAM